MRSVAVPTSLLTKRQHPNPIGPTSKGPILRLLPLTRLLRLFAAIYGPTSCIETMRASAAAICAATPMATARCPSSAVTITSASRARPSKKPGFENMRHPNGLHQNFLLDIHGVALHLPIMRAPRADILRQTLDFSVSPMAHNSSLWREASANMHKSRSARAIFKIKNHIGIVENIGHVAIIVLVEMVHIAAREVITRTGSLPIMRRIKSKK